MSGNRAEKTAPSRLTELHARNQSARSEILQRVRQGVGRGARPMGGVVVDRGRENVHTPPTVASPRPSCGDSPEDRLNRFVRYSQASSTTVELLQDRSEVPAAVARYLTGQSIEGTMAAWKEFADLNFAAAGVAPAFRPALPEDAVGLTGAYCALAETGTLVVLSGPDTPAVTSLLPATHIAVLDERRLVAGMEEAFALIRAERGQLPRGVNFISGPSRTGDIEQTIVLGAHGPCRVHVLILRAA